MSYTKMLHDKDSLYLKVYNIWFIENDKPKEPHTMTPPCPNVVDPMEEDKALPWIGEVLGKKANTWLRIGEVLSGWMLHNN